MASSQRSNTLFASSLVFVLPVLASGLFWLTSVTTDLTDADRAVFAKVFAGKPLKVATFDDQIATILTVQRAAAAAAPTPEPIPLRVSREPADVVREGKGFCYDRSRFIEKALLYAGLAIRHVAIYNPPKGWSQLHTLLTPKVPSHAITEVRTSRGWLVADSLSAWMGLTADGRLLTADMISHDPALMHSTWDKRIEGTPSPNLNQPFFDYVGLYSRNGQLYWPYTRFPNVNWDQAFGWLVEG